MSRAAIILKPDDAPRVASLHAAAAADAWPVEEYRTLLKQPTSFAMGVAEDPSDLLQSFLIAQIAMDTSDLLMIATAPDSRRQGLARFLLRSLLKRLGERGIERLTLDVAADNASAVALYESMRFVTDGKRPNYYRRPEGRVDAVLMSRPVAGLL